MKHEKKIKAQQEAAVARDNWAKSFHDNPEQTQETIRKLLRQSPYNVKLVEAALRGPIRWSLKRKGALDIVKKEISDAKKYWKDVKNDS